MSGIPKVKVCCIMSEDEAKLAVAAGAHAIGLVGAMPSGPGVIGDREIARIAGSVGPVVRTFLLTSRTSADGIATHHAETGTTTVQICDAIGIAALRALRILLPAVSLVQVVHVGGPAALEMALEVAPHVDGLLLDSGRPDAPVKELGGTGRTHDWSISRRIREQANRPVFLAGGLNQSNVRAAIDAVEPFGVDLCSGVRTGGRLDPRKLDDFFSAVAGADAS